MGQYGTLGFAGRARGINECCDVVGGGFGSAEGHSVAALVGGHRTQLDKFAEAQAVAVVFVEGHRRVDGYNLM